MLGRFKTIIVPEINLGQLLKIIRANYLIDAVGINEMRGKMFRIADLVDKTVQIIGR